MKNDIGNRIYTKIDRLPRETVERFRGIPSSNIGDMMNRLYCMREYINRIGSKTSYLLGTAVTVNVPDGDNAFIHLALDIAQKGDVLVINGNGCTTRSLMGEIMFTYAQNKGIAGIVVDGAIRDADALDHLDIPVYAAAVTPQGPYKNGPGEINVPIACGGQVVMPGDILAGDGDGICVIRASEVEKVIEMAEKKRKDEEVVLNGYHTIGNDTDTHQKRYGAVAEKLGTVYY